MARAICARFEGLKPAVIVEPTCGLGHFLQAASEAFPEARRLGFELHEPYIALARGIGAEIRHADFFEVDWEAEAATWPEPILVVGNPPWVTNAEQSRLDADNLPPKRNTGLVGYDAITGRSNFDIAEWMFERLLTALKGRNAVVALLVKTSVAHRLIGKIGRPLGLWRIDAAKVWGAHVDAGLLAIDLRGEPGPCPIFASLDDDVPTRVLAVDFRDPPRLDDRWRSGIKHDAAKVMQLLWRDGWVNGHGESVDVEEELVFPLMKSSDLANDRSPTRGLIVPQQTLGDDTTALAASAPKAWAYLYSHRAALDGRQSRIYVGRPPFSVFGVGDYTFAPWKVAISGMYRSLGFRVVGPHNGRPVVFDDTCYQLAFGSEQQATEACQILRGPEATALFESRIWWESKRPITKSLLASFGGLPRPA